MRIAYVAHVSGAPQSGVFHKIVAQVGQWRAAGHVARVFLLTQDDPVPWTRHMGDVLVCRYDGAASRIASVTRLVSAVRQFHPTLFYVRRDLFYPQMLWLPRVPLVIEVNADDLNEYEFGRRTRALYNARTRGIMLRRAGALVFATAELSARPSFRGYRATHAVVTNGIDLDAYPELPAPTDGPRRLAFVGHAGQRWHGVDKVLTLARLRSAWRFDIVGMRDEGVDAPPNVRWHGSLDRPAVLGVLAQADVGIGTLALHRDALDEACPLKVREYLAVGLPVIYGYSDPDVDRLDPYVLRIANSESNVMDALPRIDAFLERSRGLRVPRASVSHLDVACKEEQRLALFDVVARGDHVPRV